MARPVKLDDRVHLVKRLVVGRPFATSRMGQTLLPKRLALPVFASDALSSVAYATEAMLVVLLAASAGARDLLLPISLGIALLLAVVVSSYRQTVRAYSSSGGAYVVARENLGRTPSLVAAGALMVDYVLTVAVSIAAGVLALTSAVPGLAASRLELALVLLAGLAIANLRGVREAGTLFALPTYGFVVATLVMIAVGLGDCLAGGCPRATVPDPLPVGSVAAGAGVLIVLRAFASGCTALTGVEAIANGVTAFRPPQARNAAQTLLAMGAIAIVLLLGVSYLAYGTAAAPSNSVSVVSEIARAVFPAGGPTAPMYYAVQAFTFAILVLAANTACQGFPRLAALLARDRFLPRHFANLGDRLVYSNGLIVLVLAAALLLVAFHASVSSLIHLYLIGVFTAFTLSQAGMVRHWARQPGRADRARMLRMAINGAGALATGTVTLLVVATKFTQGAWMVLVALPLIVLGLARLRAGHDAVARRLQRPLPAVPRGQSPVVVCVQRVDAALAAALRFARSIRGDSFVALHASGEPGVGPEIAERWSALAGPNVPLEVLRSDGAPAAALAGRLETLRPDDPELLTVVVPELFRARTLRQAAHRTTAFELKTRLLGDPGIVVADVRLVADRRNEPGPPAAAQRIEAVVLVSEVNAAAAQAAAYAVSLRPSRTRAVYVALDSEDVEAAQESWRRWGIPVALEVVEAPLRTLEHPVLDTVRAMTADPGVLVLAVIPELAAPRWWQDLLYNERSLYLRWLLLFEDRVVVCSVPYPVG